MASSGASASGANLVNPDTADSAPRAGALVATASVPSTSAATSVSLLFEHSANSVNGYAAQA